MAKWHSEEINTWMGQTKAASNTEDKRWGIIITKAQQDLQNLVKRMHADLDNNVYDQNERSLALKVKEKGAVHFAAFDAIEFNRVTKQLATNIVDVTDTKIRIQFWEFIRRLERHVAPLDKKELSITELIKVFLESERRLYVDIEVVMHAICVAATSMSVEPCDRVYGFCLWKSK